MGGIALTTTDLNEDGIPELIVGAPGYTNIQIREGGVFIWDGVDRQVLPPLPDTIIEANLPDAQMGFATVATCDIDGDHKEELLVHARKWVNNLPAILIFQTDTQAGFPPTAILEGSPPSAQCVFISGTRSLTCTFPIHTLEIFDISGKLLMSREFDASADTQNIPLAELTEYLPAPGVYILNIQGFKNTGRKAVQILFHNSGK